MGLSPAATAAIAEIVPARTTVATIATTAITATAATIATAAAETTAATAAAITATAARATATATIATTEATAATATFFAGTGFVHTQGTAVMLVPIQRFNGRQSVVIIHLYKAEATKTTRVPIVNHSNGFHRAVLFKQVAHIFLCCLKRQITNINFLRQSFILLTGNCQSS